nr:hypothetical protein [Nocardia panacis]
MPLAFALLIQVSRCRPSRSRAIPAKSLTSRSTWRKVSHRSKIWFSWALSSAVTLAAGRIIQAATSRDFGGFLIVSTWLAGSGVVRQVFRSRRTVRGLPL